MATGDFETVNGSAQASFIERKSEFIGYIRHTDTEEQAVAFINEIRAVHRKATHNVYAYILRKDSITRYSDDGEPQGTAGVPVLEVLKKEKLTDVCCVVTRYFGGILLGGGGLVRAYSHSAKIAADAAERMIMRSCVPMEITADYDLYGKITNILTGDSIKVTGTDFDTHVKIRLFCTVDNEKAFTEKLRDITNGRVDVKKSQISFENFA